jgi:hypothetical protein
MSASKRMIKRNRTNQLLDVIVIISQAIIIISLLIIATRFDIIIYV